MAVGDGKEVYIMYHLWYRLVLLRIVEMITISNYKDEEDIYKANSYNFTFNRIKGEEVCIKYYKRYFRMTESRSS